MVSNSHINPHPPQHRHTQTHTQRQTHTQTHTPAWNTSSVNVSRMNTLNDGNMDVKTTSVQKAKCKGPTKEATGTNRKWKEEDAWESPSVVFPWGNWKDVHLHTKTCFPKTQEKGKGDWPRGRRNGGNIQPEDGHWEAGRKKYNPPGTGATPSINRTK